MHTSHWARLHSRPLMIISVCGGADIISRYGTISERIEWIKFKRYISNMRHRSIYKIRVHPSHVTWVHLRPRGQKRCGMHFHGLTIKGYVLFHRPKISVITGPYRVCVTGNGWIFPPI